VHFCAEAYYIAEILREADDLCAKGAQSEQYFFGDTGDRQVHSKINYLFICAARL